MLNFIMLNLVWNAFDRINRIEERIREDNCKSEFDCSDLIFAFNQSIWFASQDWPWINFLSQLSCDRKNVYTPCNGTYILCIMAVRLICYTKIYSMLFNSSEWTRTSEHELKRISNNNSRWVSQPSRWHIWTSHRFKKKRSFTGINKFVWH